MTAISTIPNLGPATEAGFVKAGITTAEHLRALGADEAYRLWLLSGQPAHFIGYYALVMGLQGRPWNDCNGDEKQQLRKRFDALKSSASARAGQAGTDRERHLQFLGVVEKKRIGQRSPCE